MHGMLTFFQQYAMVWVTSRGLGYTHRRKVKYKNYNVTLKSVGKLRHTTNFTTVIFLQLQSTQLGNNLHQV